MVIKTIGTQKESQTIEVEKKNCQMLHYDLEYDTTAPEQTIRSFVEKIKEMVARYEGNRLRISQIEAEMLDVEHYMEIGHFKKVTDGYRLYRKLAELRKDRRACKNENDLLQPIYEYFHATEVLNKLSHVQGECAKVKSSIDSRVYMVRTNVLDDWLNPDKEPDSNINFLNTTTNKKYSLVWKDNQGDNTDQNLKEMA